jgi:hypothetical protein
MFIPDPGSDFFPSRIPDAYCLHPGSRIIIKKFKYFNPQKSKKWFLNSKKCDLGCSSRIPDSEADIIPSRIPGSKRHPIPDPGSGSTTLLFIIIGNSVVDPDPHHFGNLDPQPHRIIIRIHFSILIRIKI